MHSCQYIEPKPLSLDAYWSAAVVSSVTGHLSGSRLGLLNNGTPPTTNHQLNHPTTQIQIDDTHTCPALATHFPLLYACVQMETKL